MGVIPGPTADAIVAAQRRRYDRDLIAWQTELAQTSLVITSFQLAPPLGLFGAPAPEIEGVAIGPWRLLAAPFPDGNVCLTVKDAGAWKPAGTRSVARLADTRETEFTNKNGAVHRRQQTTYRVDIPAVVAAIVAIVDNEVIAFYEHVISDYRGP